MKTRVSVVVAVILAVLHWTPASGFSAAANTALPATRQEAPTPGQIVAASHDEIVAKAKKEGSLRALLGFDRATIKAMREGFGKKYPFIKTHFEEFTGTDAAQRYLLELKAAKGSDWDITHVTAELQDEFLPYLEKIDLLGMAQDKVLQMQPKMVSPTDRNIVALSSTVDLVAYNKRLVAADKLPKTWDDFLKPEYSGRKFLADVKPNSLAGLVPSKGLEWVETFARQLAGQQPVWVRGHTRYLNAMQAGEYGLFCGVYYHTVMRLKQRGAQDLEVLMLEPVPVRLTESHAITKGARRAHAAILFFEYVAGAEGQKILYDVEPFKSSIYASGSKTGELTRGRKTSIIDWDHLVKQQDYMERIVAAYGFPREERK
jgi:iron(III) transport system substrate-binding protein